MQYFTDMDINKPKQYTVDNNVKMPTLWWDFTSTGEDFKLGQELIKTSGGTWLGGTNYVIKPNREIIHLPEGTSLRDWLEANDVKKGETSVNHSLAKPAFEKVTVRGKSINFTINTPGKYSIVIYNLSGKIMEKFRDQIYASGNYSEQINKNLSKGQYFLSIKTPNGTHTEKIIVNATR